MTRQQDYRLLRVAVAAYVTVFSLMVTTLSHRVAAQTSGAGTGTTLPGIAPGAPAGSYSLSGFETVNLFNGNLDFHLPLLNIGGRGTAGHTITKSIERRWTLTKYVSPENQFYYWYGANADGWIGIRPGYGPGVLQGRKVDYTPYGCPNPPQSGYPAYSLTRLTFTTPDGTEHELRDQLTEGNRAVHTSCLGHTATSRGKVFRTADGTSITFISDTDIQDTNYGVMVLVYPSGFLLLKDGTRYRIDEGEVTWIRDRNGNYVSFTYDQFSRVTTITDSMNRVVQIDYYNPPTLGYDRISYTGFGSTQREIQVYYAQMNTVLQSGSIQTYDALFPPPDPGFIPGYTQYNPLVVSEIRLPNQKNYLFKYNPYGELARVKLPTGGAIEYFWGPGPNALTGGVLQGPLRPDSQQEMAIYRRVTERRVLPDGVNLEGSVKFTAAESGSDTIITKEFLDKDQIPQAFEKHYFYWTASGGLVFGTGSGPEYGEFAPIDNPSWKEGRQYKTEWLSVNGPTLLRRQTDTWSQRAAISWWYLPRDEASNDTRITETMTTLLDVSPNLITKQSLGYDDYNNVADTWDYDYGNNGSPGPLLLHTKTQYLTSGYDVMVGTSSSPNAAATIHIRNLPTSQAVYSDYGTANKYSETTYEYDVHSGASHAELIERSGIVNLCNGSSSCPNGPNFTSKSYTTRGNVTGVSRWLNTPAGTVNTFNQYDVAGNVVKTIDANVHATSVDYSGTYHFSLPTSITLPMTSLVTTTSYDLASGKPVASTDYNGRTTTFEYADTLDRPTRTVRPDGGETTYEYGDTVGNLFLRTQTKLNVSQFTDDYVYLDGLGRPWRSGHLEGSNSWSVTDTKYDPLGRTWQVSSPYLASNLSGAINPSGVWTTNTYDTLSRPVTVTLQDGTAITTLYSGNQTTVTDQANKSRKSVTDALGRLTQVVEDPSGLNYQTNYTYDVLANLRKVEQGTQQRFFMYDSMSRLIRAKSPEQSVNASLNLTDSVTGNTSWSMAYSYDSNSNLAIRTDARGIVTTYSYDEINRNKEVSYSDATPKVKGFYDEVSVSNGKGRLWKAEVLPNGTTATLMSVVNAYDEMGRVKSYTQGYYENSQWEDYTSTTSYDLAGNRTFEVYPSGRGVSTAYGLSGRLTSVGTHGSSAGANSSNLISGVTYAPFGGLLAETYGSSGLVHAIQYNSRLQVTEIKLGTAAVSDSILRLNYLYGTASPVTDADLVTTQNNGSIGRIKYSISGTLKYAQTFQYDSLERLKYGVEHDDGVLTEAKRAWWETFEYDRWGNRGLNTSSTSYTSTNMSQSGSALALSDFSAPSNQISKTGYVYDFAGNLTVVPGRPDDKYDGENRLVSSTVANVLSTYVYDANGKRVKKTVGSAVTKFVYNVAGQLIAEYGGAETSSGESLKYATADHLGSPRAWTNAVGQVAANGRHDYAPFGEELTQAFGLVRTAIGGYPSGMQTDGQRRQFGSYERDSESGLDFVQARHYSNIQGRFISPDEPLADQSENEPQSWNLYSYVRNSPCINNDPTGRNSCYYRQDNSKIGCDGQTSISVTTKGGQGTLIYAPKNGKREEYDLNTVKAITFASTAPNPIADLAVQMQLRGPAIQQAIGIAALPYVVGAGAAGIGAAVGAGGVGFGSTITTLGGAAGSITPILHQLSRTDQRVFEIARGFGMSAVNTFDRNLMAFGNALFRVAQGGNFRAHDLGNLNGAPIWGSLTSRIGIVDVNGVTMVVHAVQGQAPRIIGPLPF